MTGAHLGDRGACRRRSCSATAAPREGGRRRGHADGRHHPRSIARFFPPNSATNMTRKFTTCFYAHGPDRTFLKRPYHEGPLGCPVARLAQTWPQTFAINENGVILGQGGRPERSGLLFLKLHFWLYVKKTHKKACFFVIARDRRTAPPNPAGGGFVWLV